MIRVRIDADEIIEAVAHISSAVAADKRPALDKVGGLLRRSFARNFEEGGRPPWKPLSPNTVAAKAAGGPGAGFPYATQLGRRRVRRLSQMQNGVPTRSVSNILIARGELRDSAVQLGKAGHVHTVTANSVEEGTQHYLAAWHQDGTKPYTIRPVRARALRFLTAKGTVITKLVHHPGLPARPFILMQPEDIEQITEILTEGMDFQ